jgi:hypothetical protein
MVRDDKTIAAQIELACAAAFAKADMLWIIEASPALTDPRHVALRAAYDLGVKHTKEGVSPKEERKP